jgi:enterobactin synthetase component D
MGLFYCAMSANLLTLLTDRLRRAFPVCELGFHALEFDARSFSLSAFAHAGLELPSSIARSVTKRQREFYFGRLCAREAMKRLGAGVADVHIGAHREPVWPAGLVGSISHTRNSAAAVAASARQCAGIGIDLELLIELDQVSSILPIVAGVDEVAVVSSATTHDAAQALTLIFSVKEAFFKASYEAVSYFFDFSVASVVEVDANAKVVFLMLNSALERGFPAGAIFPVHYEILDDGSVFAACIRLVEAN